MENSHKFFANTACCYYPCHETAETLNCLFCYCPLFFLPDCGGDYTYTARGIKSCVACLKVHGENGWDFVQRRLMREFQIEKRKEE